MHFWEGVGYPPMGGQIVDATLVAAPKQRNTAAEKEAIKGWQGHRRDLADQAARAAQKDADPRWSLKFAKARGCFDEIAHMAAYLLMSAGRAAVRTSGLG